MCDVTPNAEVLLPLDPAAASMARAFLRTSMCLVHHGERLDDAELLVTELVTNGVRHAAPPIVLRVECEGPTTLRALVRDGSPNLPQPRDAEPTALSGRGLTLVDYISSAWGVQTTENGKGIWFRLGL